MTIMHSRLDQAVTSSLCIALHCIGHMQMCIALQTIGSSSRKHNRINFDLGIRRFGVEDALQDELFRSRIENKKGAMHSG